MTQTFIFQCENDNGEWIDTLFSDTSAKSLCREWRLSTNVITGETYGTLLRSEGPEDEFEFSVNLPKKLVSRLIKEVAQ